MKLFFSIFLIVLSLNTNAQYVKPPVWQKYNNLPLKSIFAKYNWQSKYLFNYDIKFYFLNINVDAKKPNISGNVQLWIKPLPLKDTFAFELSRVMTIDSILINNKKLNKYTRNFDNVIFIQPSTPKNSILKVNVFYHGKVQSGGFFSGVSTQYTQTWEKWVTWTLSEPFSAKDWFPVKQDLQDKADSAWIFLTTDSNYMAGSEGLLTQTVNLPNGKTRYEWKTRYPIDYYLISFAVADYMQYNIYQKDREDSKDSLLIQNLIYNSNLYLAQNKSKIEATKGMITLYNKLFGKYPFQNEKYGHSLTELSGGMEHQTMTTLGSFNFDLVAHELGHQWFGDNVTCATWSDIWINEGFATYSNYLAEYYLKGKANGTLFITKRQKNALKNNGSVYIPESQIYPGNEWRIFSGQLSYDKGACIIHMLRHEINNDTLFFNILKSFQDKYKGSTATGNDFKNITDSITGINFDYFFKQWYYGEGYPVYEIVWGKTNDTIEIKSVQTSTLEKPALFKMWIDYQIKFNDNTDTLIRLQQTDTIQIFKIKSDKKIKNIIVDPNHWTLQKIALLTTSVNSNKYHTKEIVIPNPIKNNLSIYFKDDNNKTKEIIIYNVKGQQIIRKKSIAKKVNIPFLNFPKGIYIVKIKINNVIKTKKIIKE